MPERWTLHVPAFSDLLIRSAPHLPWERQQFRFPRSKKRRIRKKWAKNPANWRQDHVAYMCGDTLLVDPATFSALAALAITEAPDA